MHQILGGLREVPLDVSAQTRVVIKDPQRDRTQPLAPGSEHFERSVVEIQMPQGADMRGFIAADLSRLASLLGANLSRALMRRSPRFFGQATGLHVAFDRGIRREPPERGLRLHQGSEIIEVELIAPVWMVAVLENQPPGQQRGQGDLTAVFRARRGARRRTGSSCLRRAA